MRFQAANQAPALASVTVNVFTRGTAQHGAEIVMRLPHRSLAFGVPRVRTSRGGRARTRMTHKGGGLLRLVRWISLRLRSALMRCARPCARVRRRLGIVSPQPGRSAVAAAGTVTGAVGRHSVGNNP